MDDKALFVVKFSIKVPLYVSSIFSETKLKHSMNKFLRFCLSCSNSIFAIFALFRTSSNSCFVDWYFSRTSSSRDATRSFGGIVFSMRLLKLRKYFYKNFIVINFLFKTKIQVLVCFWLKMSWHERHVFFIFNDVKKYLIFRVLLLKLVEKET